ncbi:MAG: malate dehydrogenase [Candidatus Hydrogenedentes bacterium]|nr:malate dehydrogenase [Candidatus Hydrogenedentota bacterium]
MINTLSRPKIVSIGAGNIGATFAQYCAEMSLGDILLLDIVEGLPQGKALDLAQASSIRGYSVRIMGSNDFSDMKDADIVVVSAGFPRKPGMSRLDLLEKNGKIISEICENIKSYAPNSIVIIITNPLDIMVQLAYHILGFPPKRVMGMAGILDSARMSLFVASELEIDPTQVNAMVLGSHGDLMVPLPDYTCVNGIPITQLLSKEKIEKIIERTRKGGAEIVSLLKTGSAYYAPSASAVRMVKAILQDEKSVLPCAVYANGEYQITGYFVGLPCVLGRVGVEKIIELPLTQEKLKELHYSVEEVKQGIKQLRELGFPIPQ